jgi:hypothetical protein
MVKVLEKINGDWTTKEKESLTRAKVEYQYAPLQPRRLAVENDPLTGQTFDDVFGHSDFQIKEMDKNWWKP